jgi:hypothetical protein
MQFQNAQELHAPRRGQSLIGILVSVFLLIGLAAFFLMPHGGNDGKHEKSVLRKSMDRAEDVGTTSYLSQIQQGINMYKQDNDGKTPASLDELKHYLKDYPPDMWFNHVDKKPFLYDPASGTICEDKGTGCPPGSAPAAPGANPPPPGNPPAPGADAPAAPPANPISPTGPGGIHMRIPQPGAGAADAMKDN